ncbi:glycoside hydrolase superfamily [Lentinula lateritia]|uniref:Glycoside hydrolase superfamily n=1 Tax=Lentinula lateritia TaxID=40482 RepID=A0ABQ8VG73_9AGAR|nr:glycoside hydrolase superfamily [Lentinula lateritia]
MRTSNNLSLVIFGLLCASSVLAAPIPRLRRGKDSNSASASSTSTGVNNSTSNSTDSGSSSGSGPWFAVYTDRGPDPAPAVDDIKGFNVVIMSFILSSGPADMAMAWQTLSASQRSTIKQQYQAAGIKLLVSAFGSTETPTTSGKDPKQLASTMAAWVKQYGVDGIDVDYEDIAAMNKADGKAEQWLIDFTNALRTDLPQGQYILTHAPMAPWMGSGTQWTSGAYVTVNTKVGSLIDWYNTQFYNQGASEYTTCDGLLTASSSNNPKSSVFEIEANGFELNKIVIGKPGSTGTGDASNGQMSTGTLAGCVSQAKGKGWDAGVMSWEYPDANSQWITAVRGSAYPIDGSSDSGSSSSSTSTADAASPTSVGSSGGGSTDAASPTSLGSSGSSTDGASPTSSSSTVADSDSASPTSLGSSSNSTPTSDGASPTSTDADSGSTAASTDAGSVPTTDSSSPTTPATSASTAASTGTFNNGMWTPSASTATFNNGMWTPTTAPATTVATPVPQRREERTTHRMVRRRGFPVP